MTPTPHTSTLFPYTTLFRSRDDRLNDVVTRPPPMVNNINQICIIGSKHSKEQRTCSLHEAVGLHHGRQIKVVYAPVVQQDRKSTRLNSSHTVISYAVFCLKK